MLKLQSIDDARKLKLALRGGGFGGNGGKPAAMQVYGPPTVAESGGKHIQYSSSSLESAKSASGGGEPSPVTTGLSANSAISASTDPQHLTFEVIINPEPPLSTYQKIDAIMAPCELLSDDKAFLLKRLPITTKERKTVTESYKAIWLEAMEAERAEHKKQNAGRRKANLWLLRRNSSKAR
jgi:hypothetical protein